MKITIEIKANNAAFADGNAGAEVARILRKWADKIETQRDLEEMRLPAMDINGNKVGFLEAAT